MKLEFMQTDHEIREAIAAFRREQDKFRERSRHDLMFGLLMFGVIGLVALAVVVTAIAVVTRIKPIAYGTVVIGVLGAIVTYKVEDIEAFEAAQRRSA